MSQKQLWPNKMRRKLGAMKRLEEDISNLESAVKEREKGNSASWRGVRLETMKSMLSNRKDDLENLKNNLHRLGWQGE